ncbi:hypothetical protein [Candidatus Electrothrix sp.]|uniref:hypothetical protein n=1 Tax=Candidatus Electrothrix sp. TaxID=2170559 RepID=UPI0040573F91
MNMMLCQQRLQMRAVIFYAALLCLLPLNTVQAQSGNNVLSEILSGLQPFLQPGEPQPHMQPQSASGSCNARYEIVINNVDGSVDNKVIRFGEFQSQGYGRRSDRAAARARQNAEQCVRSHWQARGSGMVPSQCQDQQRIMGYHIHDLEQTLQQEVCQGMNPHSCTRDTVPVRYSLFATVDGEQGCGTMNEGMSRTLLASGLTTRCPCQDNRRGPGWGNDRGRGRDGWPGHRPRRQIATPQQVSPAQGITFYHIPRTTLVTWQPVRRAASYLVEVKYNGRVWTSLTTSGDATFASFDFPGAGQGQWRVTAKNRRGRQGTPSPWYSFSYQR